MKTISRKGFNLLTIGCCAGLMCGVIHWTINFASNQMISARDEELMAHASSFTLLSIDPGDGNPEAPRNLVGPNYFHGYPILGRVTIGSSPARADLVRDVCGAIDPSRDAMCFAPRIGIRAASGINFVDLLICFQCDRIVAYDTRGVHSSGITNNPEGAIRMLLAKAHVPVAP